MASKSKGPGENQDRNRGLPLSLFFFCNIILFSYVPKLTLVGGEPRKPVVIDWWMR